MSWTKEAPTETTSSLGEDGVNVRLVLADGGEVLYGVVVARLRRGVVQIRPWGSRTVVVFLHDEIRGSTVAHITKYDDHRTIARSQQRRYGT